MSTFLTIGDLKQLDVFWAKAQERVYTDLAAAFPDRDADDLFTVGISLTLAWSLRNLSPDDVADIINQSLGGIDDLSLETGWRLVRMT